ncbi:unnamed protein product [Lathyrus oleraceus]
MGAFKTKTPAQSWESYGDEHPKLQAFAIRVLGLTCSSSRCERNWSAFEMAHTKRRNRLKQKTTNGVIFVMTNSKLAKKKKNRKIKEYKFDDIEPDNEWIVNNDEDFEKEILGFTIENDDFEVTTIEGGNEIDAATAEGGNENELPLLKMNWRFITLMMSLMEKKRILALKMRMS